MKDAPTAEARPYHHGDLRRALVDAARRILETEGATAMSLRAVAREAGVSPAAPYHHFKDKAELLEAVALEGWAMLDAALSQVKVTGSAPNEVTTSLGVAYVCFAREHPALYRVMYDIARDQKNLPQQVNPADGGAYYKIRAALVEAGADPDSPVDLELATIAGWCAAHGVAEMAGFQQFEPLKEAMGGETAFLRAIFDHMGMSSRRG